jgi:hypothetical protein
VLSWVNSGAGGHKTAQKNESGYSDRDIHPGSKRTDLAPGVAGTAKHDIDSNVHAAERYCPPKFNDCNNFISVIRLFIRNGTASNR